MSDFIAIRAMRRLRAIALDRRQRCGKALRDLRLGMAVARMARPERRLLEDARRRHDEEYRHLTSPLVSVTIPTYNRGKLLVERTLPSIFDQTYQNFEIVVVGDHCPDNTAELLGGIKDPRLRFYDMPERGKYPKDPFKRWTVAGDPPSNKAIDMAQGQWMAYMDDDDVMAPDHIETLLEAAMAANAELAHGRHACERAPGHWTEDGTPEFPTGRRPFTGAYVPHSSVLYRSYLRFFKYRGKGWRYRVGTDALLWYRMGWAGVRTTFVDRVVSRMPLRPGEAMLTPLSIQENS